MFRIAGSIIAATTLSLTLSLAVTGCSSDSNTNMDAGPTTCDLAGAEAVFTAKCTGSGCHNATEKTSGLDLTAGPNLAMRLVGVMPNATVSFLCGSSTMPYLTAHTSPATGLLLNKISSATPSCGARMPFGQAALSTSDINCIQTWANSVTSP
jgi:hypothetical protein